MELPDHPAPSRTDKPELPEPPRCGLRGLAPPGFPFQFDEKTVRNGLSFTLDTTLGAVDLPGKVAGGSNSKQLLAHTVDMEAFEVRCKCVRLERLMQRKRAADRPKDPESIAELQALPKERRKRQDPTS